MSIRTEQVEATIHQHLGEIFAREVEVPEGTLATIANISVPPDLKRAVVSISVLPFDKSKSVLKKLKGQRGHIQKELHKRLVMKSNPVLEFRLDTTEEHASKLEALMDTE